MKVIVGGIIKKDNKVLMVQEAQAKCYGKWNFPAGHLDDGESVLDGAIREILEETGCKVKLTKVLPIISSPKYDLVRITFLAEILEETIAFDKNEILDVKWIEIDELKNMSEDEVRAIDMTLSILKSVEENELYPLDIIKILKPN